MSKKQLLNESEIRRFMKLANLEPLAKNVINETGMSIPSVPTMSSEAEDPMAMAPDASMDAAPADVEMGGEDELEVEIGSEGDPDDKMVFEKAVKALATGLGIDVELESQEEHDEEDGEEMHDLDDEETDDEEDEETDEEEGEEDDLEETKYEEEEGVKHGGKPLTEDELVETVLSRVTARLVAEVKNKKMSVKERMKLKKEQEAKKAEKAKKAKKAEKGEKGEKGEKAKKVVEEATDAKGGGPLLSKGGNKHDVYKGHSDMTYAKGEKGGKGGHSLETTPAKAEHTVTHGGKNLATLGGNKKKV